MSKLAEHDYKAQPCIIILQAVTINPKKSKGWCVNSGRIQNVALLTNLSDACWFEVKAWLIRENNQCCLNFQTVACNSFLLPSKNRLIKHTSQHLGDRAAELILTWSTPSLLPQRTSHVFKLSSQDKVGLWNAQTQACLPFRLLAELSVSARQMVRGLI